MKKTTFKILLLVILGQLVLSQGGLAQVEKDLSAKKLTAEELIHQESRPTMQQIYDSQPIISWDYPAVPPLSHEARKKLPAVDFANRAKVMIKDGPRFIASLEQAFPGATWAFIGRDSEILADLVDAFYISIGQKGRVVRLNVSKSSFKNVQAPDEETEAATITRFVTDHGLELNNIKQAHPYIFLDVLVNENGRQGRKFLGSIYASFKNLGGKPAELLRKVNMIGLPARRYKYDVYKLSPIDLSEDILTSEEQRYSDVKNVDKKFGELHKIINVPDTLDVFNSSGYNEFSGTWTGKFGPMRETMDGTLTTDSTDMYEVEKEGGKDLNVVSEEMKLDFHRGILKLQKELLEGVSTPDFKSRVVEETRRLGFVFPFERPSADTFKLAKAPSDLTDSLSQLINNIKNRKTREILSNDDRKELQKIIEQFEKEKQVAREGSSFALKRATLGRMTVKHMRFPGGNERISFEARVLNSWISSKAPTQYWEVLEKLDEMLKAKWLSGQDFSVLVLSMLGKAPFNHRFAQKVVQLSHVNYVLERLILEADHHGSFGDYSSGASLQEVTLAKQNLEELKTILDQPVCRLAFEKLDRKSVGP